jgi:hypothetical protein
VVEWSRRLRLRLRDDRFLRVSVCSLVSGSLDFCSTGFRSAGFRSTGFGSADLEAVPRPSVDSRALEDTNPDIDTGDAADATDVRVEDEAEPTEAIAAGKAEEDKDTGTDSDKDDVKDDVDPSVNGNVL